MSDIDRETLKKLVLTELESGPLSVEDVTKFLSGLNVPLSRTIGKSIAWSLAEEGKAIFNNRWMLELPKPEPIK